MKKSNDEIGKSIIVNCKLQKNEIKMFAKEVVFGTG